MTELLGDRFGAPRTTTCLYTLTADRDFVVDRVPGCEQICVALGAAHGFKFAAWFGRTLAELRDRRRTRSRPSWRRSRSTARRCSSRSTAPVGSCSATGRHS